MKRIPKIGETLYSLNVGNSAKNREQILTPVKVISVGRKYFECQEEGSFWKTKFHLDTWKEKTEYTSNQYLYENPTEWEEEKESKIITDKIRDSIGKYGQPNLSLNQLKRILLILEELK